MAQKTYWIVRRSFTFIVEATSEEEACKEAETSSFPEDWSEDDCWEATDTEEPAFEGTEQPKEEGTAEDDENACRICGRPADDDCRSGTCRR